MDPPSQSPDSPDLPTSGGVDDDVFVAEVAGDQSAPSPLKPKRREPLSFGGTIAWLTIILISMGMFALTSVTQQMMEQDTGTEASIVDLMPIELQGKVLVSQSSMLSLDPATDDGRQPEKSAQAEPVLFENEALISEEDSTTTSADLPAGNDLLNEELDVGPYEQRLCYAILLSELKGPSTAIEHLETTDRRAEAAGLKLSKVQQELRQSLGQLLENYQRGNFDAEIDEASQVQLKEKLGWLGELILVPAGTEHVEQRKIVLAEATKGMILTVVGGLFAVGFLGLGIVVSTLMIVCWSKGWLRARFENRESCHNIYAETFAIWMAGFFGGQIILPLGSMLFGIQDRLLLTSLIPLIFFGSLLALVWPVIRGIPFSQVRRDIGWTFDNPGANLAAGLAGYLSLVPALAIGLIALTVVMNLTQDAPSPDVFTKPSAPGHPMQELVGEHSGIMIGLMVIVACVAAPIVEETMFRGVFYRHLRDWIPGNGRMTRVVLAGIVNSFFFAAIHPQGLMGIPILGLLAFGFSLVREWRGSLLGPMLMHSVNNGLVTMMLFLIV